MTLIAAPIFVRMPEAVEHSLERAGDAMNLGARLLEWRVDALAGSDEGPAAAQRLVAESPAPCIITCRPSWEGGQFDGDDHERWALYEAVLQADARPRYLDIELRTWLNYPHEQERIRSLLVGADAGSAATTSLILSVHDFTGRPSNLLQKIEVMTDEPMCAMIKIAWRARSLRDNLEAFDLFRDRQKPTTAICMGEFGRMSRVLAPKFGGFLTFAVDSPEGETAPGQPSIMELRERYRFESISRATAVYGVVGWPVEHSRSPHVHNAAFASIDYNGVFLPLPIPAEYEHFKATVGALVEHEQLTFRGASVTLPHKANLLRFVREHRGEIDPLADSIGAANTLIIGDDGSIACANTDAPAAVDALCAGMNIERAALAGRKVAILGAGGVARAAAVGMASAGANVIIFGRTQERVRALAAELAAIGLAGKIVPGKPGRIDCGCFDIIVNATPVGMAGGADPERSPLPPDAPLDEHVTVFDTVYTPERTPLLREAEARGARTISGVDMFLRQAALQFEHWTGHAAPLDAMRRAMRDPG